MFLICPVQIRLHAGREKQEVRKDSKWEKPMTLKSESIRYLNTMQQLPPKSFYHYMQYQYHWKKVAWQLTHRGDSMWFIYTQASERHPCWVYIHYFISHEIKSRKTFTSLDKRELKESYRPYTSVNCSLLNMSVTQNRDKNSEFPQHSGDTFYWNLFVKKLVPSLHEEK